MIRDPGSGMETVWILDPGWKKVGSGIRDKHPGSATLASKAVSWIWIRSDLKLFTRSRVGSGINLFGSRQPLLGMNMKQNFCDKIHNFSTSHNKNK
jgi:hypothetical protein